MDYDNRHLMAMGIGMGVTLLAFILYHIVAEELASELRAFRLMQEINEGFDRLEAALKPEPELTSEAQPE